MERIAVVTGASSGIGKASPSGWPGKATACGPSAAPALTMLTRSLAFELAPRHIGFHAADPGYIRIRLNPDGTGTPERGHPFLTVRR